jgi:hypothetical protein
MTSLLKSFRNKKSSKTTNNPIVVTNALTSNPLIINNNEQQHCQFNPITNNQEINLSDLPLEVKHNLFAKLPHYYGRKNENFPMFIEIIESKTDPLNIAENDKLVLLKYCLLDKAAEAFIKIKQQSTTATWKHMIDALQQILPVEHEINYHILHQRKQQPAETPEDYAHIIQEMVNKLYPNQNGFCQKTRNMETVKVFTNGVQQPLKRQLKQKTYKDLKEILHEAKILQQQRQHPDSISYEGP